MPSLVSDLTAMLEPARVLHSREDLLAYGYDGTAALSGAGAAVVMVRSTDEIVSVVKYAAANRIPIVGRGSGTGLSGVRDVTGQTVPGTELQLRAVSSLLSPPFTTLPTWLTALLGAVIAVTAVLARGLWGFALAMLALLAAGPL